MGNFTCCRGREKQKSIPSEFEQTLHEATLSDNDLKDIQPEHQLNLLKDRSIKKIIRKKKRRNNSISPSISRKSSNEIAFTRKDSIRSTQIQRRNSSNSTLSKRGSNQSNGSWNRKSSVSNSWAQNSLEEIVSPIMPDKQRRLSTLKEVNGEEDSCIQDQSPLYSPQSPASLTNQENKLIQSLFFAFSYEIQDIKENLSQFFQCKMYKDLQTFDIVTVLVSNRAIYVADNENFAISRRRLPYTGIGLAGVSANREHVILHARKQIAEGDLWFSNIYAEKILKHISFNYKLIHKNYLPVYSLQTPGELGEKFNLVSPGVIQMYYDHDKLEMGNLITKFGRIGENIIQWRKSSVSFNGNEFLQRIFLLTDLAFYSIDEQKSNIIRAPLNLVSRLYVVEEKQIMICTLEHGNMLWNLPVQMLGIIQSQIQQWQKRPYKIEFITQFQAEHYLRNQIVMKQIKND